jgi:hypothetical protein
MRFIPIYNSLIIFSLSTNPSCKNKPISRRCKPLKCGQPSRRLQLRTTLRSLLLVSLKIWALLGTKTGQRNAIQCMTVAVHSTILVFTCIINPTPKTQANDAIVLITNGHAFNRVANKVLLERNTKSISGPLHTLANQSGSQNLPVLPGDPRMDAPHRSTRIS